MFQDRLRNGKHGKLEDLQLVNAKLLHTKQRKQTAIGKNQLKTYS